MNSLFGDVTLKVQRLTLDARLPEYATDGSACFDLYATETEVASPGKSVTVGTGIAVEIPSGFVMLVFSRSGDAFKRDVRLGNCVGVIDSDYRGEVKVRLRNEGDRYFVVERGNRVAQALLVPLPRVSFQECEVLAETSRGEGGFGSTGR